MVNPKKLAYVWPVISMEFFLRDFWKGRWLGIHFYGFKVRVHYNILYTSIPSVISSRGLDRDTLTSTVRVNLGAFPYCTSISPYHTATYVQFVHRFWVKPGSYTTILPPQQRFITPPPPIPPFPTTILPLPFPFPFPSPCLPESSPEQYNMISTYSPAKPLYPVAERSLLHRLGPEPF